jgi:hypothetical protein
MNINGKDIPSDWLVQVRIKAYGNYYAHCNASIAQVLEQDYNELDHSTWEDGVFYSAECEIRTLPDCRSDEANQGEYLGGFDLDIADKNEPVPPLFFQYSHGCIAAVEYRMEYSLPMVQARFLDNIQLFKQNLHIGPFIIPISKFISVETYHENIDIEWFINGRHIQIDSYHGYAGLLREIWSDISYILTYTRKNMLKHASYFSSFGLDIQDELLNIIALMPQDKRRNIFCNQKKLHEALDSYLKHGVCHLL